MKKLNIFALIGLIFFNITVALALFITIYALLFSAWVIAASFILSPSLVIGAHLLGVQSFAYSNFILSGVLCALAIFCGPLLIKISRTINRIFKDYIAFNWHAIYS